MRRAVLHAYTAGVNAYIQGARPAIWRSNTRCSTCAWTTLPSIHGPLDTLAWLLATQLADSGNVSQEIMRAQALTRIDEAMLALYTPPPAPDAPSILSAADLGLPDAAPDADPGSSAAPPADYTRLPLAETLAAFDLLGPRDMPESTAWVVSGDHTASGLPLLAAAPGYPLQMPSPYYEVGLYCIETPELCPYNLAGLSVPGVPGIFNGHNGHAAWVLSGAWIDEQDLLVVRLNPDNPLEYAWDGGWREMTTREETLVINGVDEPQTFTVTSTHLGPVIASTSPLLGRDRAGRPLDRAARPCRSVDRAVQAQARPVVG